jgi:hypothetical protein
LSSNRCSPFWIPPGMQPGRYRMSKEIEYGFWSAPRGRHRVRLTAEFEIA